MAGSEAQQENVDGNQEAVVNKLRDDAHKALDAMGRELTSQEDREENARWLREHPNSTKVKELQQFLSILPGSVKFDKEQLKLWNEKIDAMLRPSKNGGPPLLAPKSEREYREWGKSLKAGDKAKYNKKSDLDNPQRQQYVDIFMGTKDLGGHWMPEAVRKEHWEEFCNADLQERIKLVTRLINEHKKLKEAAAKLPQKLQDKHREEFKKLGLDGRRALLKKLGVVVAQGSDADASGAEKKVSSIDRQRTNKSFFEKTKKLESENLLPPASKMAYDMWFEKLSDAEATKMANDSDIERRMPQRKQALADFNNPSIVPPEVRQSQMLRFKNMDLDKRLKFLSDIKNKGKKEQHGDAIPYPDEMIDKKITQVLSSDPTAREKSQIFTMLREASTLRHTSEVRYHALQTEDLVKHASNDDREVHAGVTTLSEAANDDHEVDEETTTIDLVELTHKRESRLQLVKDFFRPKLSKGKEKAKEEGEANLTLENKQHQSVSSQVFEETMVRPFEGELEEYVTELVTRTLPGADRKKIQKRIEKHGLERDIVHEAAA